MLALKKHCAKTLTALRLREIGLMNDAFLEAIRGFKLLEELNIADPGNSNECTEDALLGLLVALSGKLRALDISSHSYLTDRALADGLHGAKHMEELVARHSPELTDAGVAEFFSKWENPPLRRVDFGRNHELGGKALVALLQHSGERLEELCINGWGGVEADALKELGRRGRELRRLDVGWVREVDDFLVKEWMEGEAEDNISGSTKGVKRIPSLGCTKLNEVR
ncbi:hypothetical protein H0H93_016884, partial [Arthromyces matolae]